jgi:peptide/nickel transport system permease protein
MQASNNLVNNDNTRQKLSGVALKAAKKNNYKLFWKVFLSRKLVVTSFVLIIFFVLVAIFAPLMAPYDPNSQNLSDFLQQPSFKHLLGTDTMGRDTFSRMIFGSRISLLVGIVSVVIAGSIGIVLGLTAGVAGGWVDTVIMRIMDAMMSLPMIIMALFIGSVIGKGLGNVMLAVGISMVPSYARLTRGQVVSLKQLDFVTAGTIGGAGKVKNTLVHILPNCLSPIIVLMTMNLGFAILSEAALSFLAMGITPPTASWGAMVSDGYKFLSQYPVLSISPGICIILVVLAFNIVGDALRDALDPRLRGVL